MNALTNNEELGNFELSWALQIRVRSNSVFDAWSFSSNEIQRHWKICMTPTKQNYKDLYDLIELEKENNFTTRKGEVLGIDGAYFGHKKFD